MNTTRIVRTLPAMYVGELDVLPIRFGLALDPGESIAGTPEVTCVAYSGLDAAAPSRLIGPPVVDGTNVLQRFKAEIPKVTYLVSCTATISPSGRTVVAAAHLPVRRAGLE
jgi:hypothetical protein